MLIKLIVRVRHALMTYPQQSYDVSVHVCTYTKRASATQTVAVDIHASLPEPLQLVSGETDDCFAPLK